MENNRWTVFLKYGVTILIGGLIAYAVTDFHGYGAAVTAQEKYRILCDAFTIPGVVLMLCAALVWISNEGMFTGIAYSLTHAVLSLIPLAYARNKKLEKYADYLERKNESRLRGYGFLFFVGAGFFVIALVFLVLFYRAA